MPIEQSRLIAILEAAEYLAKYRRDIIEHAQQCVFKPPAEGLDSLAILIRGYPIPTEHEWTMLKEREHFRLHGRKNETDRLRMRRKRLGLSPNATEQHINRAHTLQMERKIAASASVPFDDFDPTKPRASPWSPTDQAAFEAEAERRAAQLQIAQRLADEAASQEPGPDAIDDL